MGIGPGNIANIMPPRPDDAARRARDAARQAREQASAKTGQAMQIGAGGITVTDGGSISIEGSGSLNVGSGALNSAGSISAATTISAGGNITGGGLISTGAASVAGGMSVGSLSASGGITAGGQVVSTGPAVSPGSHGYNVTSGYVACWINGDGTFGTSPSSELVKTGLTQMTADDARRLLNLTPYWGRYVWDADDAPLKVFFLADDVRQAGFGPDVAPVVVGEPLSMSGPDGSPVIGADGNPVVIPVGEAYSVNYSQMVVPLVAAWHDGAQQMQAMGAQLAAQQTQIDALVSRLAAAGIA